tara:strand:+ start:250 stop:519 length:270 start_codon:yes stop_codon:yes gene_type:complete
MKVKDLLEIQGIIDNRIIPSDMNDNKLNEHYSQSKDEFMSILDMDLVHLVRSYSKCLDMGKVSDQNLITQKLDTIIDTSYELRGIIKND